MEVEKDLKIPDERQNHWKDIIEDNTKDKRKVHALGWEVYIIYNEGFIKI